MKHHCVEGSLSPPFIKEKLINGEPHCVVTSLMVCLEGNCVYMCVCAFKCESVCDLSVQNSMSESMYETWSK